MKERCGTGTKIHGFFPGRILGMGGHIGELFLNFWYRKDGERRRFGGIGDEHVP